MLYEGHPLIPFQPQTGEAQVTMESDTQQSSSLLYRNSRFWRRGNNRCTAWCVLGSCCQKHLQRSSSRWAPSFATAAGRRRRREEPAPSQTVPHPTLSGPLANVTPCLAAQMGVRSSQLALAKIIITGLTYKPHHLLSSGFGCGRP